MANTNAGISAKIAKLLAKGERVVSLAAGRVRGDVTRVEGNATYLMFDRKIKGTGTRRGVTTFEDGDKVKLKKRDDHWVILTDFSDEDLM